MAVWFVLRINFCCYVNSKALRGFDTVFLNENCEQNVLYLEN